ncbi:MAG: type II toxin-antitoxin system HipA family toxin [Vicinamibacteria bacterium]|nr:type II toxin-antitoxin system HipA family toxin [Vicinamibacteria bacterium]
MPRTLVVWWDRARVGTLRVDRHGAMRFAYAAEWLSDAARPAISCSLPKREKPFSQRATRPFFAGLLPEDAQREAIASALGISRSNDFAFLDALGGDVAGALSLWPEGVTPPEPAGDAQPRPLDDDALSQVLDSLPTRPLLAGRDGLRLSLAGAQSKLPVVLADGRVALPAPGQPTTHILKPPLARFPHTTENEAFVMTLAAEVGLDVAPVAARVIAGRPYLLVTRYDRHVEGGRARRLHQEDFCQALAIPPERKYAAEGGPNLRGCFDLARRATTVPAKAVLALLDAAVFNVIAGNADAHGKNFSLLHAGGAVRLAPLYDLLCTAAYPDLSPRLAMKIGGGATLDEIGPAPWTAFAEEAGLAPPFVRRRVGELAEAVALRAQAVASSPALAGLDASALESLADLVVGRARRVGRSAGPTSPGGRIGHP